MLFHLTLILVCQLAGELIAMTAGLPLPGPVIGMAILLSGLLVRGSVPDDLAKVGDALLDNLSLLFVPAGVGVMLHAGLIGRDWLPISIALIASTLATIAVTALVMSWLAPADAETSKPDDAP